MLKQILFILYLLATLGFFAVAIRQVRSYFKLAKPGYKVDDIGKRISRMLSIAFGQTKMFQVPLSGVLHALLFWGFLFITVGTGEMVLDGIFGAERILSFLGPVYDGIIAVGDVFAGIILISCFVFLGRRYLVIPTRYTGIELKANARMKATLILSMIIILMLSLIGMNTAYVALHGAHAEGVYPLSSLLARALSGVSENGKVIIHEANWWIHIGFVLIFLNVLPRSKHFHVLLSIPNVFLSRLEPAGKLPNMPSVMNEVKSMMNPEQAPAAETTEPLSRFGVKDVTDFNWKSLMDSFTCTECGRCTAVCPANTTGKKLSPRKIVMDTRKRMQDVGPNLTKDANFTDEKFLVGDYISHEELWACTTCGACMQECPVNISHVPMIIDMRRYLVMEESKAPDILNSMFVNIENNGTPWPFSASARMDWANNISIPVK